MPPVPRSRPAPSRRRRSPAGWATPLARRARPYYRRVINATGVILHTNLGRAPLAAEAVAALAETAGGAQRLELDLESGRRGGRDEGCAALLRELTGCAAATVVNNNAAATLLVLAALARGRAVVLSRGEMVEIGGSFRVPEILRESGARLVEVGTTNRTHERDYRAALVAAGAAAAGAGAACDDSPAVILKVHASNYRIEGFTAEVPIEALVAIGREHGVPVVHDLGSGCLVDTAARGLPGRAAGPALGGGRRRRRLLQRRQAPRWSPGRDPPRRRGGDRPLPATSPLSSASAPAGWSTPRWRRPSGSTGTARSRLGERVPALARLVAGAEDLRRRAERLAAEVVAAGWRRGTAGSRSRSSSARPRPAAARSPPATCRAGRCA